MAKFTINIIADNSKALQSVAEIQRKLDDIERNPIEIKIDAVGDTEVLKMQAKLEQARASTARANAKIAESEAKVKIARQQTKTVTAQTVLEEKKAETAKKQATLETKKATRAENERQVAIERGNTALKKKEEHEARANATTKQTELVQERAKSANEKRATSEGKVTSAIKKQESATKSLTNSIQQYIEWYLRWTLTSNAFQAAIGSIREALETMKAVDDELVTVRKVTGFAADDMKRIEEQAYKTASAYGVAANEYLESVAAFARAGYKEQSDALAELSTKTQIVGDTTAEVANQFLLSVDAAYKYGGSIEELSKVLDGANELDNKYATSIQKIAEGMGIVAPVAAQMNVSIDELAAAIGTITAVTQRSGSEAARALRALFLNIAGDTKTEIDEGVTWTTGEIEGLREVVKLYAKDAYEAAQATGSVIDPMRAMEGLAKSMQEGLLTEQKLIEMVSDIGGKLRSSQLLAIIQNWDMYQSMLQDYAGAIGSADKEVANALDSWSRKTAQLKNAWAEFISHLIETRQIKNAIDLLTGAVKLLDSSLGKAAVTAGLLFTALKVTGAINGLITLISGLITTIGGLTTATELFSAVWAASPFMVVALGAAAIFGIVKAVDALNVTYDEQKETLEELEKQYDKTYGSGSEIDQLRGKTEQLTAIEKNRLAFLEAQEAVLKKQIEDQKKTTFQSWRAQNGEVKYSANKFGGLEVDWVSKTGKQADEAAAALRNLNKEYLAGEVSAAGYKAKVQELVVGLHDNVSVLQDAMKSGEKLTQDEYELVQVYEILTRILAESTDETKSNTDAKKDNAGATGGATESEKLFAKAMEEVESKSSLTYGTIKQLDALYPGFSAKILDASGNLTEEGKAALSSKSALVDLIGTMISANATGMSFEGQIAALMGLAAAAGIASDAVASIFSGVGGPSFGDDGQIDVGAEKAYARSKANPTRTINKLLDDMKSTLKNSEYAGAGGGGGGGGGGSTEDPELTRLKEIISLRKQELSFLEASGASVEDQVAKQKEIQSALHDQAEYLRQTEGESANVIALSTEWWNIQSKIAKLLEEDTVEPLKDVVALRKQELSFLKESGASEEDQIAKMREIQDSLHQQAEEMRRVKADEKDILALSTEWWSIQNDILELEDKIAQKLRDEIAQTLTDIVESLQSAADAMISPLQEQLDALNEAHNATEERREEEEKIAAVQEKQLALEKARIALENAQRERNVRQYNSRTNQWEWVANAKNVEAAQKDVETAQKNLVDAQNDLAKYYADQAYETAKENLEKQISNTRSAFDALKQAMEEAAQAIKDGKMSYQEAYAYIKQKMKGIYNEYGVDLTDVLDSSITEFGKVNTKIKTLLQNLSTSTQSAATSAASMLEGTADDITSGVGLFTQYIQNALDTYDPEQAIKELSDAIRNGIVTDLNDVESILRALNGDYAGISAATARLWALTKMQANSIAWHSAANQQTKDALHAENVQLGSAIGLTYNSTTGTWHDSTGKQVYTLNAIESAGAGSSGSSSSGGGSSGSSAGSSDGELASEEDRFYNNPNTSDYFKQAQVVSVETDDDGNAISYSVMANDGEMFTVTKDGEHSKLFQWVDWAATGNVPEQEVNRGHTEYHAQHKKDLTLSFLQKNDGTYAAIIHGSGSQTEGFEARFFDRGGILHGQGGIKATSSDEMILPPAMTAAMINAEATGAYDALLKHLGIVTAAANSFAGFGGIANNSIGEQHNGDVFYIDGIQLRNVTGSTTLNELARCAKNLALQKGS